jgi:hypothetical protein
VTSADAAGNSATSPTGGSTAQYAPTVTPVTQTAAADFTAGTQSNTYVASRSGGEVVLNPTGGIQEFGGTTVPTAWTSTSLATGSSVTVGSGVATVSGRLFRTTATFTSGREFDVVATLRAVNNQWLGLTDGDYTSTANRWAAFRTTSTGGLVAETRGSTTSVTTTNLSASLLGAAHRFEIDWTSTTVTFSVDGTVVATHARVITVAMNFAVRDLAVDANPVVLDSIWLSPYAASGTFTSSVVNAGAAVAWGNLTPTAATPTGTTVSYQVRTGATATPDASWTAWTNVAAGADIPGTTRYLQYRATLTTSSTRTTTPTLSAVTIGFAVP